MTDYKGVTWNRQHQKWVSKITHNGIIYNCGLHKCQMLAVKARDYAIISNGLGLEKLQILKPKVCQDV